MTTIKYLPPSRRDISCILVRINLVWCNLRLLLTNHRVWVFPWEESCLRLRSYGGLVNLMFRSWALTLYVFWVMNPIFKPVRNRFIFINYLLLLTLESLFERLLVLEFLLLISEDRVLRRLVLVWTHDRTHKIVWNGFRRWNIHWVLHGSWLTLELVRLLLR